MPVSLSSPYSDSCLVNVSVNKYWSIYWISLLKFILVFPEEYFGIYFRQRHDDLLPDNHLIISHIVDLGLCF